MTEPITPAADADSLWGVVNHALDVVAAGGPMAVTALIVVSGAVLACAILAAPRVGAAIATVRSGATERERELSEKVVRLESEVHALRDQLEEQSRVFSALLEHLPDLGGGIDREALARIFTPPPAQPAAA